MCRLKRKMMSILLISMMSLSLLPMNAFANEANEEMPIVEIDGVQFFEIDREDIPDGIEPYRFSTYEEAVAYMKSLDEETYITNDYNDSPQVGRAAVQKEETKVLFSDLNGSLNVTARYLSDGNTISSCQNIYSYLSGLNVMRSWKEADITYIISPNRQKLDATISGELTIYVFVDDDANPLRVSEAKVYDVTFTP